MCRRLQARYGGELRQRGPVSMIHQRIVDGVTESAAPFSQLPCGRRRPLQRSGRRRGRAVGRGIRSDRPFGVGRLAGAVFF